jgi:GntR family transcriptional regulator/MocR family aminotransferase
MRKTIPAVFLLSLIQIDPDSPTARYQQLYQQVRQAILAGHLAPTTKLPAARDLADLFQLSRNTVVNAIDLLVAEGYLHTRVGAGIFVAEDLPEDLLSAPGPHAAEATPTGGVVTLSQQGQRFIANDPDPIVPVVATNPVPHLAASLPDVAAFPFRAWQQILQRILREQASTIFDVFPDPAGYPPLRQAIAEYIRLARGVVCSPEQIVIIPGIEQAVYLLSRLLTNPGEQVWMEEPGFPLAVRAFRAAGAEVQPIPVDREGMQIDHGLASAPTARIAFVSPANSFPCGGTLSLSRRLQLLHWANQQQSWIIEDDYDSEFCYEGRAVAALKNLDHQQRVIYFGTSFTALLYPGLRLDYVILPPALVKPFLAARTTIDYHTNTLNQVAVTEFMRSNHFARHIRRMRIHYHRRRTALLTAIHHHASPTMQIMSAKGGFHVATLLDPAIRDTDLQHHAAAEGIRILPLSRHYIGPARENGLIVGFAATPPEQITTAVQRLQQLAQNLRQP